MGRFVEERGNRFDKREREKRKEMKMKKNIIYLYETTKICVTILSLENKEEGWGR